MENNLPIEGGVYQAPVAGEFKVIAVGIRRGHSSFVTKIAGDLQLFRLDAWQVLFPDPRLLEMSNGATAETGIYYGHLCHVVKSDKGEIEIIDSNGDHDWIIEHPKTPH